MTNNLTPDIELFAMMKSAAFTTDNPAYLHFLNDPSVQARIEVLLAATECKVDLGFVQKKAFDSLKLTVEKKEFEQKMALTSMYLNFVRNLIEAEPIRTREQPFSDTLLKSLRSNSTVVYKIEGTISGYDYLTAKEIIGEGLSHLCINIITGKFKGESSLKSYLTGICLKVGAKLVRKRLREAPNEAEMRNQMPNAFQEILTDLGDDFTLGKEERMAEQSNVKKYVHMILNSTLISKMCKVYFQLRYMEDLKTAQIALRMGIAYQSVKNKKEPCENQFDEAIDAIGIEGLRQFFVENTRERQHERFFEPSKKFDLPEND